MFLHVGGDRVVMAGDVVAILDARVLEQSDVNRQLIDRAVRAGKLHGPGIGPGCKAVVVAVDGVYTSGISAPTLARRMTNAREAAISWKRETRV